MGVLIFGDSVMNSVSCPVILVNTLIIKVNCSITPFKDLDFKYLYLTFQETKLIL